MTTRWTGWSAAAALGGAWLLLTASMPPSWVSLATAGGDAWTFDKEIAGAVVSGHCEEVRLTTPAGVVTTRPAGGRFDAHVPLLPGLNRLIAECRDAGRAEGAPARQTWTVRLDDRPTARIGLTVGDGMLSFDGRGSAGAGSRPAPIRRYAWRARRGNPAPLSGLPAHGRRVTLPLPTVDGEYYVTLRVTDARSRSDESTAMFRVHGGQAEVVDPRRAHAAWIDRAVVYGVIPARLSAGGGLKAVTASLDRIAALGVNTLWLSPISAAAAGDYGYAVTDEFRINPRLGTPADLKALVEAAHARHLRVILDLVANHLSDRSAYFEDAARRQQGSPYFDYFARDAAGGVAHYFDWRNLENLNYDNPEVRRMMIAASTRWVRDFDVDGFRVDAAWGPRERRPQFWQAWSAEVKRIKPDVLLLAEAPAGDPYYRTHGFAAAYDWTDKLGDWAWHQAFDDAAHTADDLRVAIARSEQADGLVFRFLDNNDTGARFATRYGLARTRVAAAMLLTLPGLPGLFMGDEAGATFDPYGAPQPIDCQDRTGLGTWYRELLQLRREHPALHSARMEMLDVAPRGQVLAYVRRAADRRDDVVVLLNYGDAPLDVRLPAAARDELGGRDIVDLLTRQQFATATVPLPGFGVRILTGAAQPASAATD